MATTRPSSKTSCRPKLPRSLEIAGCRVRIRLADLEDLYGRFRFDDRVIEIDRKCFRDDPETAIQTLRHEVLEAALLLSGVGFMERYEQEPVVRAIEQIFFPVWDRFSAGL